MKFLLMQVDALGRGRAIAKPDMPSVAIDFFDTIEEAVAYAEKHHPEIMFEVKAIFLPRNKSLDVKEVETKPPAVV